MSSRNEEYRRAREERRRFEEARAAESHRRDLAALEAADRLKRWLTEKPRKPFEPKNPARESR